MPDFQVNHKPIPENTDNVLIQEDGVGGTTYRVSLGVNSTAIRRKSP